MDMTLCAVHFLKGMCTGTSPETLQSKESQPKRPSICPKSISVSQHAIMMPDTARPSWYRWSGDCGRVEQLSRWLCSEAPERTSASASRKGTIKALYNDASVSVISRSNNDSAQPTQRHGCSTRVNATESQTIRWSTPGVALAKWKSSVVCEEQIPRVWRQSDGEKHDLSQLLRVRILRSHGAASTQDIGQGIGDS